MRFLNSVAVPKIVKGGPFGIFFTSILWRNIETNEGVTLLAQFIISKKVSFAEKKYFQDRQKGGFLVLDVGFVSFCFGRGSEVRVILNMRSSSCRTNEQKSGPYASKKLPTVRVGNFSSKAPTTNKNGTHQNF